MPNYLSKIKKNKIRSSGKFFNTVFVVVCLALSIIFADLFSGFITAGSFSFTTNTTTKNTSFNIYAISLNSANNLAGAQAFTDDIKSRGGAGYIWQVENVFYVFASCYLEENDAIKVRDKLHDSGNECEIVQLEFKSIELSLTLTQDEKTQLYNSLSVFKNTYKSLYDISVALDTNVSSSSECLILISQAKTEIEKQKQIFDNYFLEKLTNDLIYVKLALAECKNEIELLLENNLQDTNLTANIKYSYFKILKIHKNLYESINDII